MKPRVKPTELSSPSIGLPEMASNGIPLGRSQRGGQNLLRRHRFDLDVMSRRVRFVLLAAAVLAASVSIAQAFSQETYPASAKPGPQSYTLDGVVINALTGKPISGAKVQIPGRSPVFAISGPNGKFHFENIDQARVSLEVQKNGFF